MAEDAVPAEYSYVEASPFVRLFRTESRVRIIDVLLRKHYEPLSTKEIAEYADIDRSSVTRNLPVLKEIAVVLEADKIGNTRRYKINKQSPVAQALAEAQEQLFDHSEDIPLTEVGFDRPNGETGDSAEATLIDHISSLIRGDTDDERIDSGQLEKQEIFHIHGLLAELASFLQERGHPIEMEEYEQLGIRPTSVHDSKTNHEEAISVLAKSITAELGSESRSKLSQPGHADASADE